jgi:hypothetical protein
MESVETFNDLLVYFVVIWYILFPFGMFYGHLVDFVRVGKLYQESVPIKNICCFQSWNDLRDQTVEMAFKNIIFPILRKELKLKLTREAKDGVLRACRRQLHDWIKVKAC